MSIDRAGAGSAIARRLHRPVHAALAVLAVVLLILAAPSFTATTLPLYATVIRALAPEYDIHKFGRLERAGESALELTVNLNRPVIGRKGLHMPDPRGRATVSTLEWPPLQSLTVLLLLVLAMPWRGMAEPAWRLLLAVPLAIGLVAVDIPLTLIAGVRGMYDPDDLVCAVAAFMGRGGRLFLALMVGAFTVWAAARLSRARLLGIADALPATGLAGRTLDR